MLGRRRVEGGSRLRIILLTGLVFSIIFFSPAFSRVQVHAQSQSQTGQEPIKRPSSLKDISVQCNLTVNENDLSKHPFKVKCTFTNNGSDAKDFLLCFMIDLKEGLRNGMYNDPSGSPVAGRDYQTVKVNDSVKGNIVKCNDITDPLNPKQGRNGGSSSSYHFGCREVKVPKKVGGTPGQNMTTFDTLGGGGYVPPPGVDPKKLKATDFEVSYADAIDIGALGLKFDPNGTCDKVNGQANFLQPEAQLIGDFGAFWIFGTLPGSGGDQRRVGFQSTIIDPPPRAQDAPLASMPCTPAGFPSHVSDLPECPPAGIPQPTSVDLNLFYFATMMAPNGSLFPVYLNATTTGNVTGLRVQMNPAPRVTFNIPGGKSGDMLGNVTLCSDTSFTQCLLPSVEEGRRLDVTVDFHNATTGDVLFSESGQFIQDTRPPRIVADMTRFDPMNNLAADVTATDDTTSPIQATLWFSRDGGLSWNRTALQTATDVLQELRNRTFAGSVGPFGAGTQVLYFVSVQDVLYNVDYFGPVQITVPVPVGGIGFSGDQLGLWAYFGPVAMILAGSAVTVVCLKRRRGHGREEKRNPTLLG